MLDPGEIGEWRAAAPPIDVARLLRVHKYTDPAKVRRAIRRAAERVVANAAEICAPHALYAIHDIESLADGRLTLASGAAFRCAAFDERLKGAEKLLVFVITVGEELDRKVIDVMGDDDAPLDALFYETAGWLTIEASTRAFAKEIKTRFAALGWAFSLRMGPGYDYPMGRDGARAAWDLTDQRALFASFGAAAPPVSLMESCAMLPKMSRSGVFGMARARVA